MTAPWLPLGVVCLMLVAAIALLVAVIAHLRRPTLLPFPLTREDFAAACREPPEPAECRRFGCGTWGRLPHTVYCYEARFVRVAKRQGRMEAPTEPR